MIKDAPFNTFTEKRRYFFCSQGITRCHSCLKPGYRE